jgi:hypothetical protein
VRQLKFGRMQEHALQAQALQFLVERKITVFVVPEQGKARIGEMHTNLVGPAGPELNFD